MEKDRALLEIQRLKEVQEQERLVRESELAYARKSSTRYAVKHVLTIRAMYIVKHDPCDN